MPAMSAILRRLAAIAVALLTLAIVAVLALRSLGVPVALGPLSSATPAAATPSPSPSASGSVDPLAAFAAIEAQVVDLRDLPPADIGPADIITRAELADELAEELDATWSEEQLAADNLTLRALGLLSADQDVRALTEQLYAGQVLGFYDFEEKRMVVVSDAGLTAEAKVTYAHEYTHALQDAAFDTAAAHDALSEEDDAALARLALEEGDATFAMFQWAIGNLADEELVGIGSTPVPDMRGIPAWMVAQLEFPYLAGATFVTQLWASGGWDAVNAAYDEPPTSSEQVLHPEKYLAGEEPLEVAGVDLAGGLGAGWAELESTTVGEAMVGIWLEYLGVSEQASSDAALGWGGDRLVVASGPQDAWTLAWSLAWDAAPQAEEFAEAYAGMTPPAGMARRLVRVSDTETLVVHASSTAVLDDALAVAAVAAGEATSTSAR
jgi:hypothetical protein